MNQAIIVRTDGSIETLDHKPTLKEAQEIVGGYIEFYKIRPKDTLVLDDEGLLKGKPVNLGISNLYGSEFVGDVIILKGWKTVK